MCNVWLALDSTPAQAYASLARRVKTRRGTAVLFADGSAGYLTVNDWRQLLTRSHRDAMIEALEALRAHMQRTWWSRLLNYYNLMDVEANIQILRKAL